MKAIKMLHEKTINELEMVITGFTTYKKLDLKKSIEAEPDIAIPLPQLKEWAIAIVKELMKCDKGIAYKKNKKCNVILFGDQLLCERHGYQGHPCDGRLVNFLIEKFELSEDDLK